MPVRCGHTQARLVVAGLIVSLLAGCGGGMAAKLSAASPQELATASNFHLCEASRTMYASVAIDQEIARRGLDCTPYAQAAIAAQQATIARKSAAFNAGAAIMMMNNQPRPAVAPLPDLFPKRKHCTTLGYGVQCTEY